MGTFLRKICLFLFTTLLVTFAGCTPSPERVPEDVSAPVSEGTPTSLSARISDTTPGTVDLRDEAVALCQTPAALPMTMTATHPGTLTKTNDAASIDYSNTKDGYVMVCYAKKAAERLKAQVKGPTTTYTYNLTPEIWAAFPLSDGNGTYQVTIYKNISDSKYTTVLSQTMEVTLTDEFAPFLHANQYVDFDRAPKTVAKAAELTKDASGTLEKVSAVYDYVIKNLTYDTNLAASVKSGYLPILDTVLEKKTGICFDYAALMTGMLRSQDIPCKLVVGYAGSAYHAWISVWS